MVFPLMLTGSKDGRVSLPCLSKGLSHAKEADPAHEDPQRWEATYVW